jgi:pimeloyl-ACP methyl ester carboxylesterase
MKAERLAAFIHCNGTSLMQRISTRQHWIDTPSGQLYAQSWNPDEEQGTPIVLLHDSLGCVALWRDFPERLAQASGRRVIAYDRLGFGQSAAHPGTLALDFIEEEATGGFQAVRQHLDLSRFEVFGHSVGGGMAVNCAAVYPQACRGLITESAQAFVDSGICQGIRAAEREFAGPGQLKRLHKYHGDKADWVLRAWVDTWLSPAFSQWTLDGALQQVRCPVLSLHGEHDEFGSHLHPERITSLASGPTTLRLLENCGHVPHREHPDEVLAIVCEFLRAV